MSDVITKQCQFMLSDLIRAHNVYHATTAGAKVDKLIAIIIFLYTSLLIYFYGFSWGTIALFLLVPFAWFDFIRPIQIWILAKRNPQLCTGLYQMIFDDNGYSVKTSMFDARRPWSAYSIALESNDMYLLVYGKGVFAVVPKRIFISAEEKNHFENLLSEKIGSIRQV